MTRTKFHGFAAWVAAIDGKTTCHFWWEDPTTIGFDHGRSLSIDLGLSPQAARQSAIAWTDIRVDDNYNLTTGGLTRIGPTFPEGPYVGSLYLADAYLAALPPTQQPQLPASALADGRAYEYETVQYDDGRRYYGFHARIVGTTVGAADVEIYNGGESNVAPPAVRDWLDLQDASICHPFEVGYTEIGTAPGAAQEGALFLERAEVSALSLTIPKLPPGLQGGVTVPAAQPQRRTLAARRAAGGSRR